MHPHRRADTPEDQGLYGSATRRNTYMGYGGSQDYVQMLRDTVVAVMIEKKGAVDELDEILEIPGVDMIQWGGSDYSMSIGRIGERNHPDVVDARKQGLPQVPGDGQVAPGGDTVRRERQGVPRHGRPPLLHRHGHLDPLRMVDRERRQAAPGHVGHIGASPRPPLLRCGAPSRRSGAGPLPASWRP